MIREFAEADASAVRAVVSDALVHTNTRDYPRRIIDRMVDRFSEEFFVRKSHEDVVVVAEVEGVILGTARLDKNLITNMFVSPQAQGQGIGRALTQDLERRAQERGFRFVRLYGSLSAIEFYERLGYEQVEVSIHDVFGTNAIMQKSFA